MSSSFSVSGRVRSFGHAFRGIAFLLRTQHNAWIHALASVAVIWAQTEDGVRGFLVEKDRGGFETRDIKGKFSLRASVTSELFLQDVPGNLTRAEANWPGLEPNPAADPQ